MAPVMIATAPSTQHSSDVYDLGTLAGARDPSKPVQWYSGTRTGRAQPGRAAAGKRHPVAGPGMAVFQWL